MDRPATYEFTEAQNEELKVLGSRMRLFGIVVVLVALLLLAGAAVVYSRLQEPLSMIGLMGLSAVYLLVLGGPKLGISGSFSKIVETSKNDIDLLMNALGGLQMVFLLNCVVVIAVLVGTFLLPFFVLPG
jgi:hypothetical protein